MLGNRRGRPYHRDVSEAIALESVTAGYGRQPVLDLVSLTVAPGEFVAVAGRSGSGKTTLLRVIAGLITPATGAVRVLGRSPADARRAKLLGLVAQDARLHPWLTVLGNVRLPLQVNDGVERDTGLGPSEWLERVGLAVHRDRYPHELSGGMRQRVALVRALVTAPEVLLLDEPLAALDAITREDLRAELMDLWSASGCSVIHVTHDLEEAVLLADRVVVIGGPNGRVVGEVAIDAGRPRPRRITQRPELIAAVESVRALLPT